MPRAGLSAESVIERAGQMLDEPGDLGLNLSTIANSFGVRVPSLYKHVQGLTGLHRGVTLQARRSLTHALTHAAVGRSRDEAITSIARAYRRWAREHPGQYPLAVLPVEDKDPEEVEVAASFLDVMASVLADYRLTGDGAIDAIRFLRATLHGFVSLETNGGFELVNDLDRSFDRAVASITTALEKWATPA